MAEWLALNDYQKEFYHTEVSRYDTLILEVRGRGKDDPENGEKYRQEMQGLRQEFISVVTNALEPEQVKTFNALTDYEKRPDRDERGMARVIYGHEERMAREAAATESDSDAARGDEGPTPRKVELER